MNAEDFGTFTGFLLIVLYMLPAVIALCRKHSNWLIISLLNFLLGWTIIVWIVCLIWSFVSGVKQTIIIREEKKQERK
ncbi:superinfection immunity protein [Campylobacter taeniopygiae]|uniref:superinfection immunity protein n=1 Tax=Campylobacter taeniopygiae TaxID=2510188 RepID=UPI003D6A6CA6